MKKNVPLMIAAGFAAAAMGAVSFAGDQSPAAGDEDADGVDPRIGEEVNSICFQRSIDNWRALKKEDDVILLERGVNDWYRVELLGACDYRTLRSAQAIGIDSRPAGGCVSRGDVIIVADSPGFDRRCSITRIYKWDDDAVVEETPDDEDEDEDA